MQNITQLKNALCFIRKNEARIMFTKSSYRQRQHMFPHFQKKQKKSEIQHFFSQILIMILLGKKLIQYQRKLYPYGQCHLGDLSLITLS